MNKLDFNTALSTLMELAISQGNKVSDEQMRELYKDILTEEGQYEHIYAYLSERKIKVVELLEEEEGQGKVSKNRTGTTSKAMDTLVQMLLEGDHSVRNLLVEKHLKLVETIAEQFEGKGALNSDLIQEGNLSLIEAVDAYDGRTPFKQYIISKISTAMEALIESENGSANIAAHLVERVNALSDATEELAELYGRQATLEEICTHMSLSEDEVKILMKVSLDALSVEPEEQ